jgi:hypothetical protein
MLTLEDAAAQGCNLFNLAEIRDEHAPDEYANLYNCQFVDDSLSAFKFNELQKCTVDQMVEWRDIEPMAKRPVGNREVWAGYDPQESEDGDNAALVIALPPDGPNGRFRMLERHQLRGADFEKQAEFIIATLSRYNCTYLGVDAGGVGSGVYQLVRDRMRGVVKIEYSLEAKTMMVMKAQHTIARGRVEFDASWIDLQSSFLSIKKALTGSGRAITFKATRTEETGHADLAWAAMHIFINEPLDGKARPKTRMEIIGGESEDPADVADGYDGGGPWGDHRFAGERRGTWRRDRDVRVRRPGSRPRPAPTARPVRMLAQRPLVRAADPARWPGPRVPRVAAS